MKKILVSLMACATLAASAEVTTFVFQGAPMCRYDGQADNYVAVPSGFNFRFPSETKQRVPNWDTGLHFIEKSLCSDLVELWEGHIDTADGSAAITDKACGYVSSGSYKLFWNRSVLVTPAEGVTITGMRMKLERPETATLAVVERDDKTLKVLNNFSYNPTDSTLTLKGSYDKPFYICNMGQNGERKTGTFRFFFIEVTTSGTPTQVAMPEYSIKHGMVAENETIELTCPTPGAKIYYTVDYKGLWDGSRVNGGKRANDPTTASTLYTGPISIEKDAIIRAIAVKDGMANSFVNYHEYYTMPAYEQMATFDFMDHKSILNEDGNQIADFATYPVVNSAVSSSTTEKVSIVLDPAVNKDVTITGTITNEKDNTGCDITLSNSFGGVVELRPLKGSKVYISVPDDKYLSAVYMEGSISNAIALGDGMEGTFKNGFVTTSQKIWTYSGKDVYEVELSTTDSGQYLDRFYVFYSDIETSAGIEDVAVDGETPVEFFNLQGIRVANPDKGIYIQRQGTKTTKVIL